MAKKAFIIGKNTKSLRWSERDADLMCLALKEQSYEVTQVNPSTNKYKLLEQFDLFINEVSQTDTVIFYFSGHAYTPGGKLLFVFDEDLDKANSKIDASHFTTEISNSDAQIKLIILDCCRANTEGKEWKPQFGNEKYRLLTPNFSKY